MNLVRQVVYTSILGEVPGLEAIGPIMQLSRARNPMAGVSGALLFDGARFAQLLEGDPVVLGHLVDRIATDSRHHAFERILDVNGEGPRQCSRWVAGYVDSEAFDAFVATSLTDSRTTLAAFMVLLKDADVI